MAQAESSGDFTIYESHIQIRKVEGVRARTLSRATISLINVQAPGRHCVLRRNYRCGKEFASSSRLFEG